MYEQICQHDSTETWLLCVHAYPCHYRIALSNPMSVNRNAHVDMRWYWDMACVCTGMPILPWQWCWDTAYM